MKKISLFRIAKLFAIGSAFLLFFVIAFALYLLNLNQIQVHLVTRWSEPNQIGCGIERVGIRLEYRYGLYIYHNNFLKIPWYGRMICGG